MSKALIIGDSLFAEAVAQLLRQHHFAITTAATVSEGLQCVADLSPDLAIVIGKGEDLCFLLDSCPDLPVLHVELNADDLRLIRSQRIHPRVEDLLTAIQSLFLGR
jgi:ActR/RegA family two-component response regulator